MLAETVVPLWAVVPGGIFVLFVGFLWGRLSAERDLDDEVEEHKRFHKAMDRIIRGETHRA